MIVAVLADESLPLCGRFGRRGGWRLLLLVSHSDDGDLVAFVGDLESPIVNVVGDEVLARPAEPAEFAIGVREQVEVAKALDEIDPAVACASSSDPAIAAGEFASFLRRERFAHC